MTTREVAAMRQADLRHVADQEEPPPLHEVKQVVVTCGTGPDVPLTVLVPEPTPRGALLFFHGGGFVLDATAYWRPLSALAALSGYAVFVPEVRLAPEHPFPAAVHDAHTCARWFVEHAPDGVGGGPLVVGGDSSGGNLAVGAVNHLAGSLDRLAGQLLVYPMLDATSSSQSCATYWDTPGFNTERSLWYFEQYAGSGVDPRDPLLSPAFDAVPDDVPPTLVVAAGRDPLRDEAEAHVGRVREVGGRAELRRFDDAEHGFFQATREPLAQDAHQAIAAWLNALAR